MKKLFLVFPLAVMMANCSSTHNTSGSSAGTGANATASTSVSGTDASASASGSVASSGTNTTGTTADGTTTDNTTNSTTGSGTGSSGMSASGSTGNSTSGSVSANASSSTANTATAGMNGTRNTGGWNTNATASAQTPGSINWDVYDPNNYMQNPDRYLRPDQLTKTGGWTYNKDWRRNTNFTQEAVGQWQLELTPEVAAHWMPDTRRPETYASFWTPEAVMARYQATMAAAARVQDSIAALNAIASNNTSTKSGRRKNSMNRNASANMNSGTWSSGSGTTGTVGTGGSAEVSGSGTTETIGTGGTSTATSTTADNSASGTTNNNVTIPYALTAVNGNNYLLPSLSMYIDNGSFTAYTGCNNALGNIVVNGSSLHFQEASPTSSIDCIGGFDQAAFLDRLRRADSYDVTNNQFRLKQGEQVLMVFSKKAQ
ncbi:MAG: hypothetical protein JWR18_277 [Segetibacter sp.]|nr:hypothetical protein [Segetibacter sp.]